ncbi:MAG TPA: choice-of-anchor D domain-containing protein [Polyangia bacterium]
MRQGILLAVLAAALGACGGSVASGGGVDASTICHDDNDCSRGQVCSGGMCLTPDGSVDAPLGPPQISVDPSELNFGSPLVGQEMTRSFTIGNVGEGPLEIRAINLVDNDPSRDDFTAVLGTIPDTLTAGSTHTVTVTLRPSSGELDFATIIIDSNDPHDYGAGAGKKEVKLTTEPKGAAELGYCVLQTSGTGCDYALDFGAVPYGNTVERVVKFWNKGSGNEVLTAANTYIQVPPPNASTVFQTAAFQVTGGVEVPVTLPLMLVAGDATVTPPVPPVEIYFRVTFTATGIDGVVPGQNFVLSLVENPPGQALVPLVGTITGCRPDHIDCDGAPGCEVLCQKISEDDATCDGVDDDCNCMTDDHYTSHGCGVGACERQSTCVSGVESCVPGTPAPNDQSCDGVDNDCNGLTDDGYVPHTCGTGTCLAWSSCIGGVEKCDPGASHTEVCNGQDDDCNGLTDDGPPTTLCGATAHGTPKCVAATCSVDTCAAGWFDLNGSFADGCECQKSGTGGADCSHAVNLGTVADNGASVSVSGNLVPDGDEDWYQVTATNPSWASGCNPFLVDIRLTVNTNNVFRVDVYRGACVTGGLCANVADQVVDGFSECPCLNATNPGPGYQQCLDHGNPYMIRVYRVPATQVRCTDTYTLTIKNG